MSSFTDNFNLLKISLGDSPPDITVLNNNFDIIDGLMADFVKERVSLTGMGNVLYQSDAEISKSDLDVGEMVYLAKFIAPCSGLFKVSLTGHYSAGFASVHLIDEEALLLEASANDSYSLNSSGFFYNHAVVGEVKKNSYILSKSGFIIDLEDTINSYTADIFCKAGQPYVIVAQVYDGETGAVNFSNITVTYGNEK